MLSGSFDIILPPAYLPPVAYYVALAHARTSRIDCAIPFNKRRKYIHRATITDANGIISLTIPIEKPRSSTQALWSDIRISGHNRWWDIHLTALKSAYGRTPFFEYYLDEFLPFYTADAVGEPLTHYLSRMNSMLTCLLGIDIVRRRLSDSLPPDHQPTLIDCSREAIPSATIAHYYQQRTAGSTFTDGLSAVDLLFNMGPESMLILDASRI